ncbi:PLAC8-domain-containing protein [Mycena floridula]|nr:PLAC8-domain-containing protein [Mycena floridula]
MAYTQKQPGAVQGMQTTGDPKNANNMPFVDGEREWSNGTFDCFADPVTCLVSWFLPCVSYGRNRARYAALTDKGAVSTDPMEGVISDETIKYGVAHCFGCGWIFGMQGRAMTRGRYRIAGDGATDCFLSCCCAPCALTQESREIELEERALGHAGASLNMFLNQGQQGQKA